MAVGRGVWAAEGRHSGKGAAAGREGHGMYNQVFGSILGDLAALCAHSNLLVGARVCLCQASLDLEPGQALSAAAAAYEWIMLFAVKSTAAADT